MKIEEILEKNQKYLLKKCFIDSDGNVYIANEYCMHEMLAMRICESNGWDWYNYFNKAEDYLIHHKAYIKVADYGEFGYEFHYVALSSKFKRTKKIRKTAKFVAEILRVQIIYEEETS